jgi:3-isopropylmalate/(R)-2-methylmalate dehydratase small subunit
MEPIDVVRGRMVPLPNQNVDTDQITPARFLRQTGREGLDKVLFHDWRFDEDGEPKADFPLNRPEFQGATILLAGDNFGCGSSREHAPWACLAYGFRAIVSTSFADIFRGNAAKNGLLTVIVDAKTHRELFEAVEKDPAVEVSISLREQAIALPGGRKAPFPYDAFARKCLLEGKDQLGYLRELEPEIERYERSHPARVRTTDAGKPMA